jgi:cob(I)alamin adenosyltransferase
MSDPRPDPARRPTAPTTPTRAPEASVAPNGRRIPRPKKKQPGKYRVPPREQRHGLLIVNTGDGKGKTTAALGRAAARRRARHARRHVPVHQERGEPVRRARRGGAARRRDRPLGDGFTWLSDDIAADRALAEAGWERCRDALAAASTTCSSSTS